MTEKKPSKGARNLTKGPVGKSISSLMMPMMIGMLALFSYNIADTYFVGQLGTMELAAISFTFPVSFIVGTVTMGLGIGTASVCSRLFGAKQFEDVERVAVHAMLLGIVAGLVIVVIGLLTIDSMFTLLGADDTTLPVIRRYMQIYYWGGIFLVVPMIINSVLRASGNAKTPRSRSTTPVLPRVYRGIRVCVVGCLLRPRTSSPTWNRAAMSTSSSVRKVLKEISRASAGVSAGVAFTDPGSARPRSISDRVTSSFLTICSLIDVSQRS